LEFNASFFSYAEVLRPSPLAPLPEGEGNKRIFYYLAPLAPRESGLGGEGLKIFCVTSVAKLLQ